MVGISADMGRCGAMLSEFSVGARDRMAFVDRNATKVRDELETLARSQAAAIETAIQKTMRILAKLS